MTHLVASDALATAGWRRRMAVRLHQAMCRHCSRYARQLRAIGDAVRDLYLGDNAARQPVEIPVRVREAIDAAGRRPSG